MLPFHALIVFSELRELFVDLRPFAWCILKHVAQLFFFGSPERVCSTSSSSTSGRSSPPKRAGSEAIATRFTTLRTSAQSPRQSPRISLRLTR